MNEEVMQGIQELLDKLQSPLGQHDLLRDRGDRGPFGIWASSPNDQGAPPTSKEIGQC